MNLLKYIGYNHIKPSFMIIGAQKAGTSALYNYLSQHSELISSNPKEVHFFDTYDVININNYHKFFPKQFSTSKISFEATPRYLYFPGTAERLRNYNPKLKFIVLLRDPVSRAYSAWNMYQQLKNNENFMKVIKINSIKHTHHRLYDYLNSKDINTFRDWVNQELKDNEKFNLLEPSILKRGHYKDQILEYLKFFEKSQFHFIDSKNLKENTILELNRLSFFLKIKKFDVNRLDIKPIHKGEYKQKISNEDKMFLKDYYTEKNNGLTNIIDTKLNW